MYSCNSLGGRIVINGEKIKLESLELKKKPHGPYILMGVVRVVYLTTIS